MQAPFNPIVLDEVRFEIEEQTLDSSKARRQLGWEPAWDLDAGIAETVAWYRTNLFRPELSDALR
jgi:CDP-glucose 4,6-dehydratase